MGFPFSALAEREGVFKFPRQPFSTLKISPLLIEYI